MQLETPYHSVLCKIGRCSDNQFMKTVPIMPQIMIGTGLLQVAGPEDFRQAILFSLTRKH